MSEINTGGPAFPVEIGILCKGMTLRDYFAAKALSGLLADSEIKATHEEFAEDAYRMADAMMKARQS